MVKQFSLHAAGNAERGAYGSKYGDNYLQDSFPNFLFHFLFSFLFLMVQQSVFSSGSSVSFLKLLIGIGVHSPVASQFFLVVNFPFAVLDE